MHDLEFYLTLCTGYVFGFSLLSPNAIDGLLILLALD